MGVLGPQVPVKTLGNVVSHLQVTDADNSPAEMAGLKADDVLVSLDGIDASKIRFGELVQGVLGGDLVLNHFNLP